MIAAQDLMIGDWVMVTKCVADTHFIDYPDKIESIRDGLVGLESDGLETIIERIAPIPLTAEILEKNGFQQISTNKYVNGKVTIAVFSEEFLVTIKSENARAMFTLKYVHELQRALRLAGIDKTIEL